MTAKITRADITYVELDPAHFAGVVTLGNAVQGDGYLTMESLAEMHQRSFHNHINASWVALYKQQVVGFRLTWAHSQWQQDKWCSPALWPVNPDRVCYFKCNTVDPAMQGCGIGSKMLKLSVASARQQGAEAGLAHIWLNSPGNSAYRYFSKNGGRLIKKHPRKWHYESVHEGYNCPVCPQYCECEGAEMMLVFS